ncbi:MAG: DUF2079 domain-containing protein [Candidatus Njordarchaeia archaeon]
MFQDPVEKKVWVLATTYTVVLSIYTCFRHYFFMTKAYDFGIFLQAFWTTIKYGMFLYETPDLYISPSGNFFGVHFSPLIIVILFIFYLLPRPETLLVFQAALFGYAAIPLFRLGKTVLKNSEEALLFTVLYLINPFVILSNIFDFHLEAFYPILLFSILLYMGKGDMPKFYILLLINMLVLDFLSAVLNLAILFYFIFIFHRKKLFGQIFRRKNVERRFLVNFSLSILFTILTILYFNLISHILSNLGSTPFSKTSNWPNLGNNLGEVMVNIFNIKKVLAAVSYDFYPKIIWLLIILVPLLFLPILAPLELLLVSPWVIAAFLSHYPPYYQIGWQYGAVYIPLFLYATLKGRLNLVKIGSTLNKKNIHNNLLAKTWEIAKKMVNAFTPLYKKKKRFLVVYTILSLISAFIGVNYRPQIPSYLMSPYSMEVPLPNQHFQELRKILSLIPSNATVLTQNNIFPHVADRPNAYVWIKPEQYNLIQYSLGDIKHPDFYNTVPATNVSFMETFNMLLKSGDFGIYAAADGIILLKRNYSGSPIYYKPLKYSINPHSLDIKESFKYITDDGLKGDAIFFEQVVENQTLWSTKPLPLTNGEYIVKILMKTTNRTNLNSTQMLTFELGSIFSSHPWQKADLNITSVKIGEWKMFNFTYHVPFPGIYFIRCVAKTNNISLYFSQIEIYQINH